MEKEGSPEGSNPSTTRTVDISLGKFAVEKKILSLQQLNECLAIQDRCRYLYDLFIPLLYIIFERYIRDTKVLKELFSARMSIIDQIELSAEDLGVWLAPQVEQQLIEKIRSERLVNEEQIYECFRIQHELDRMGVPMSLPEIMVARGYIPHEILAKARTAVSSPQEVRKVPRTLNKLSSLYLRTRDGHLLPSRIGAIALYNHLISEEELMECLALQDRCRKELGLDFKLGQILFEKLRMDKTVIQSLLTAQEKTRVLSELEDQARCMLSLQAENELIATALKKEYLQLKQIEEAIQIQKELQELGLEKRLLAIIKAKGWLNNRMLGLLPPIQPLPEEDPQVQLTTESNLIRRDGVLAVPFLGELAVHHNMLSSSRAIEAVALQKICDRRYGLIFKSGELLVDMQCLKPEQLRALLIDQARLKAQLGVRFNLIRLEEQEERKFIDELLQSGHINQAQLQESINLQKRLASMGLHKSIPEILLAKGYLGPDYMNALADQHGIRLPERPKGPVPPKLEFPIGCLDSRAPLGRIAVYNRFLTQEELEECLDLQQLCQQRFNLHLRLGQILVRKLYIDPEMLQAILKAQRKISDFLDWNRRFSWLKISAREEEQLVNRLMNSGRVDQQQLQELKTLQKALQRFDLNINLPILMLMKGVIDDATLHQAYQCGTTPSAAPTILSDEQNLIQAPPLVTQMQELQAEHQISPPMPTQTRIRPPDLGKTQTRTMPPDWKAPTRKHQSFTRKTAKRIRSLPPNFQEALCIDEWEPYLFGQLAIREELLTPELLQQALQLQQRLRELGIISKIGEILIDLRLLTPIKVNQIMEKQQRLAREFKWPQGAYTQGEDLLLAQLLLEHQLLSEGELARCFYIQDRLARVGIQHSLGKILYGRGILDSKILDGILSPKQVR